MKIIDARGEICPTPIIMLKSALKEMEKPMDFQILVDNEISQTNVMAYLRDHHFYAMCQKIENYWVISASPDEIKEAFTAPILSAHKNISNYTVVIKNNKMGFGNDELGETLIKGFLNALSEMDVFPEYLIFYNAGVKLTTETSPVLERLKKLEEGGVKLIICGACVDFYGLKDEIKIGTISNMFVICEILGETEKIVYP